MPSGIKGSKRTYNCLHCNKECIWSYSKVNKFCDNACQGNYKWEHITKPKIERGEGGPVKRYLIEKHGENCAECGQGSTWNNKPLMLQLDHIDGNSDNNYLGNLRLLCPNCHTQTDTFGSKGQGNRYKKDTKRNSYLREYKA
jgi:endogenous inhibitor of DNA gyrase (YacG/DUF329 family)